MPSTAKAPDRQARLFRNGRNQAVRIPRELEMPGDRVRIYKEGKRVVLEPIVQRSRLVEVLARWKPIPDPFPDVDEGLLPLEDVES
ncbi:AbrB/MazE/SpoVT family DNA-binding domain-containing protein [Candidatus Binatia bacterium]|nr:AbrB/MazE/SpoVT family DNA-binding domain-containing protein [Candidatus Binatia bacterium]